MISKAIDITCDMCYTSFDSPTWSVSSTRRDAKLEGWHRGQGGTDICEECWGAGNR